MSKIRFFSNSKADEQLNGEIDSSSQLFGKPLKSRLANTSPNHKPSSSVSSDAIIVGSEGTPPALKPLNSSQQTATIKPTNHAWNSVVLHLLEAAKAGDVDLVSRLVMTYQNDNSNSELTSTATTRPPTDLINCRDIHGRHSTPLHFAAGYNRLAVVEILLKFGADVHAKDKGGLVPLHNACSYGHAKASRYPNALCMPNQL